MTRIVYVFSGTFGTGSDETRSVDIADFNRDGVPDIVAANIGEPNAVYLGRGDGSFDAGVPFGEAEQSYAVTTADVMATNGVIHVIDTVLMPPEG